MGITVYSLLWVMQDLYHQPCDTDTRINNQELGTLRVEGMHGNDTLHPSILSPKPSYRAQTPNPTVDNINPALPITMNIPIFPWSGVLKVMQDFYPQQ